MNKFKIEKNKRAEIHKTKVNGILKMRKNLFANLKSFNLR